MTLFPGYFCGPLDTGILKRARDTGRVTFDLIDLRTFGEGKHRITDDYPFGGGAGMVMKPGPVVEAVERARDSNPDCRVVLLTPQGKLFSQLLAAELAGSAGFALVCGRYEGFDDRIRNFCDDEVSIGDFVLMGGESAAVAVVEAVVRLIPGVLGGSESSVRESHSGGLLEYAQYTRPRIFRGREVPQVLLDGNHAEVEAWRRKRAIARTALRRPDLLKSAPLTEEERSYAKRVLSGEEPE